MSKKKMTLISIAIVAIVCAIAVGVYFNGSDTQNLESSTWGEVSSISQVDEQVLLDTICPTIVRVETDKLSGSGVIWKIDDKKMIVLTGSHVMENEENLSVVFYDGIRFEGKVSYISKDCDLCFITVGRPEKGTREYEAYRYVHYDEKEFANLKPGDEIFTLGSADYPAGNLYYGNIGNVSVYMEEFGMDMLWGYCDAKAGMSGGGTFDKEGNFIGMISAGNEQKEIAVLPLDSILKEWENVSDREN